MKAIGVIIFLIMSSIAFSQAEANTQLLTLSVQIFKWETDGNIDSLQTIFHDHFFVTGSDGNSRTREEYINRLRSGNFVHSKITVEENTAVIAGNTATVSGKGVFSIRVNGKLASLHLSYLEVFTREAIDQPWKVLAMKANKLFQ